MISSNISIDIETKSKKWDVEKDIKEFIIARCVEILPLTDLVKVLPKEAGLELSVSLLCDRQIQKINFEFRQQDKPTNVLSFPNLDENVIQEYGLKTAIGTCSYLFLGDILLSYEILKKESLAQKKEFHDHLTHLILHSILHLIGYDHNDDEMAQIMEAQEIKILKKLHIQNPYQPIN